MKKHFVKMFCAALLVFSLFLSCGRDNTIRIGIILPLSGSGASIGNESLNGITMAAAEVNERGGINKKKLELTVEDAKTDPETARNVFKKIESEQKPLLYITATSAMGMELAPLSEADKVVLLGLAVAAPEFTQGRRWVFRYSPLAAEDANVALFFIEKYKYTSLGILYLDDPYGKGVLDAFVRGLPPQGTILIRESYGNAETDFRDKIEKLKGLDFLFAVGFASHLENILKQLREKQFGGYIMFTRSFSTSPMMFSPEAEGVFLAAPAIYNPNFSFAREVKEKYETEYTIPLSHQSASGYDAIKILVDLLADKETTRDGLREVLNDGFVYNGVFGNINVKQGNHDISFPLFPAQIVNGKLVYQ